MSARTRTHRPTSSSPRYTKAHGIGRDRMRWPSSEMGTFRYDLADEALTDLLKEDTDADRDG